MILLRSPRQQLSGNKMILKKIQLKNIRSYDNSIVEFPVGSTVLAGDIGSGKTSILLAVEFALFGLQPGQKGAGLLRNGTDEGAVILEMEIDNQKVVVERGLKKGKSVNQSYAILEINGVKEEMSVTELKNKVLELLSYPKEFAKKTNVLYRFTVYTPQEEMKQIILETPETRLDTLRHIFGIDKYKKIRENTELFTSRLREQIRNYEGQIKDLEELRKKQEEKKQSVILLEASIEKLKKEAAEKKSSRKLIEVAVKEVEEKIKEKEKYEKESEKTEIMLLGKKEVVFNLERDKKQLEKQIEDMQKQLEKSQDSKKIIESLNVLKEEIIKLRDSESLKENELKEIELKIREKQKLEQEIETSKMKIQLKNGLVLDLGKEKNSIMSQIEEFQKIKFNPEEIERAENDIILAEKDKEEKNKTYLNILSKINAFNSKIDELKKSKSDISKLVNCPTCFQNVPEDYKANVLRKFEEDILHSKKEYILLNSEKDSLLQEIELIKQKITELKKSLDDKRLLKMKLENAREKEKRAEELDKQKAAAEQDISLLIKSMENFQRLIFPLKECSAIYEQKKKEHQTLINLEREKERAVIDNQRELDRQAGQKDSIKEREARLLDLDAKKFAAEKDIIMLEKQISILKESYYLLKKFDSIYEQRKKELEESFKQEKNKEIELASTEKEKEFTLKLIEEVNLSILKKEEIKKKLLELGELEDWLSSSFLSIISFTERNIMLKLREEFSKLFNEWFNILVPEIFAVHLDEDFTPIIEQQGFQLEYSFLSGGERTAIALAYRLALNQVINSLMSRIKTHDLVVLDEPTEGFSEQQLDKMRDVLSQLKVKQLIIVSHESKIESFVENIIKFKKIDGVTRVGG